MAEPIAFDTSAQVEELLERLQESLQNKITEDSALASNGKLSSAVERKLQERFESLKAALLANVTVAGQPYHEEKPSDMEPFDEALNRNFVTFETKVNESICANTSKRKDAPRKALAYADSAFNNYAQAREVQAGRHAKLAQAMQQKKTIEHGEVPDRAVAAEQYTRALDGLQSLTQSIPLQSQRARQALQAERDIEALQTQTTY